MHVCIPSELRAGSAQSLGTGHVISEKLQTHKELRSPCYVGPAAARGGDPPTEDRDVAARMLPPSAGTIHVVISVSTGSRTAQCSWQDWSWLQRSSLGTLGPGTAISCRKRGRGTGHTSPSRRGGLPSKRGTLPSWSGWSRQRKRNIPCCTVEVTEEDCHILDTVLSVAVIFVPPRIKPPVLETT